MTMEQGIIKINEYNKLIESNLFRKMERFSNRFLNTNKIALKDYMIKWVKDPLHQWSRQWEYPFVFERIKEYYKKRSNKSNNLKILDAGSGITFFPYYIKSEFGKTEIYCCDRDASLASTYKKVSNTMKKKINFEKQKIHNLRYPDNTFDAIYCISVLEHTKNYEEIMKEFKRVLKPGGILIVTFDIALEGDADIPLKKAEKFVNSLLVIFSEKTQRELSPLNIKNYGKILTTKYISEINAGLLPGIMTDSKKKSGKNVKEFAKKKIILVKNVIITLMKLRLPRKINLACYCGSALK